MRCCTACSDTPGSTVAPESLNGWDLECLQELRKMPIDDPIDAFQKQHAEKPNNPLGIAILAGKVAFPKASFLFEIFKKVYERFDKKAVEERITETSEL